MRIVISDDVFLSSFCISYVVGLCFATALEEEQNKLYSHFLNSELLLKNIH